MVQNPKSSSKVPTTLLWSFLGAVLFFSTSQASISQDQPAPVQPTGPPGQTWAQQQKSQSFATEKLARSPRRREWITIPLGGRKLGAWVIYPEAAKKAGLVLVLHEAFGLTDSTINTADEVASMGYIAIVPDMISGFGPNGGGTSSFPTTRDGGNALDMREDEDVYVDLNAWVDYGNKLPQANGKFAIVGLTWGGGVAFRYAISAPRPELKAVFVFCVSGPPEYNQGPAHFHKGIHDWPVIKTNVPVYGFYGGKDLTGPPDSPVLYSIPSTKRWMAAVGNFYDPVIYDGAEHAFMRIGEDPKNDNPANAAAAKASLARLEKLLNQFLN
jgi:carboxymethylenebutenolidase